MKLSNILGTKNKVVPEEKSNFLPPLPTSPKSTLNHNYSFPLKHSPSSPSQNRNIKNLSIVTAEDIDQKIKSFYSGLKKTLGLKNEVPLDNSILTLKIENGILISEPKHEANVKPHEIIETKKLLLKSLKKTVDAFNPNIIFDLEVAITGSDLTLKDISTKIKSFPGIIYNQEDTDTPAKTYAKLKKTIGSDDGILIIKIENGSLVSKQKYRDSVKPDEVKKTKNILFNLLKHRVASSNQNHLDALELAINESDLTSRSISKTIDFIKDNLDHGKKL